MKKKYFKKKIILTSVLILVLLLTGALVWGGNYLVSFAIGRDTATVDVAPASTLSEEAVQDIVDNWEKQKTQADAWMEQSEVETVRIQSADGLSLSGETVVTDAASHRWVIAVHGYRGQHQSMYALTSYYGREGYNALLPAFPILHIASGIASVRAGYSFTEADALGQIAKASVPVLFIHGSEDNFVRADMVYQVYDACPAEKNLLVVEGAGHGNSYSHAPELYFDTVFGFLAEYI